MQAGVSEKEPEEEGAAEGRELPPTLGLPTPRERFAQRLELLQLLLQKELKVKYLGSLLGYIWVIANPLLFITVYYLAFKVIMRVPTENYVTHLVSGMFPWIWFNNCVAGSTTCFGTSASLVKKTALERVIIPFSMVLNETMHFLFAFPVMLGFLVLTGVDARWEWLPLFPVALLLQFVLVFPLVVTLAVWTVFVRDLYHLTNVALSLAFFLAPVIYSFSMVPEWLHGLIYLNPATSLILVWRSILLEGFIPLQPLGIAVAYAVVLGVIGWVTYQRRVGMVGEVL